MYKILSVSDEMVVTDNGNFPLHQFVGSINGLTVGKVYDFDIRAGRVLRFHEILLSSGTALNS
ncbi:MAG: hypothetical protein ACKN9E_15010 [Microcystaceae cyanobacterium]